MPNKSLFIFFVFQFSFLYLEGDFYFFSFFIVFAVGLLFYLLKWIAAGDVKLASIMAMAIQPSYLGETILLMALLGGVQAFYYMAKHFLHLYLYRESKVLQQGIPYGVAICFGFYFGLFLSLN